jgi:5-methylthioadenosine/S-adenosylhomocysteine deaminase
MMQKPHLIPTFNPVSHIAYAALGADVDTTIIDGKIVMENRRVNTLDERKIIQNASERATRLLERAGIKIAPKWIME